MPIQQNKIAYYYFKPKPKTQNTKTITSHNKINKHYEHMGPH